VTVELARKPPLVVESTRPGAGMLDWIEFSARFFPGHRPRHDLEALVAYGKYRRSGDHYHPAAGETPSVSVGARGHPVVNGKTIAAPSAELSSWEGEGGTTPT
jgi:hypothetical protein